jgi:hypothetical protein
VWLRKYAAGRSSASASPILIRASSLVRRRGRVDGRSVGGRFGPVARQDSSGTRPRCVGVKVEAIPGAISSEIPTRPLIRGRLARAPGQNPVPGCGSTRAVASLAASLRTSQDTLCQGLPPRVPSRATRSVLAAPGAAS